MSDRLFKLLLIDHDPIFRLGLRAWLEQFTDLQVVADVETGAAALEVLATLGSSPEGGATAESGTERLNLDLVVLDLELADSTAADLTGLELCQQLKTQWTELPVLSLSTLQSPPLLAAARETGVEGYCPKSTVTTELVNAVRRVAAGETYWTEISPAIAQATTSSQATPLMEASDRWAEVSPSQVLSPLAVWRQNLRRSGLRQIEMALREVMVELDNPALSVLDRAVLSGRRRELLASYWLVNRLLAPGHGSQRSRLRRPTGGGSSASINPQRFSNAERLSEVDRSSQRGLRDAEEIVPVAPRTQAGNTGSNISFKSLQSTLFDRTLDKLQSDLQNLTETTLEIDILRETKRRELLYVILRQLEDVLEELRFSQVQPSQLPEKRAVVIQDVWRAATTEFFGKYYTLQISDRNLEVVNVLLGDAAIVQTALLNKIPGVTDFLAHLLFQTPLIIDNASYAAGTPEALERAEALMQNLLVQVANAVVQPLLNHFADVETIKQSFYDRRLISTREIERFRNSLSWKYRLEKYIGEPKAIFESRYWLYILDPFGIVRIPIYAPRNQELEQLSRVQLAVTLALETRDAIAPRLRAAVAFIGSGVVYILTQVVGRGIGLVGRGILQGIGSSWQESKFGKNGERQK